MTNHLTTPPSRQTEYPVQVSTVFEPPFHIVLKKKGTYLLEKKDYEEYKKLPQFAKYILRNDIRIEETGFYFKLTMRK